MQKVIFTALNEGDGNGVDARGVVDRVADALTVERYPGLSLQVEDRDATERWLRQGRPAWRLSLAVSVWIGGADDIGDVEQIVSDVSPHYAGFLVTEDVPRWEAVRATSASEPQPGVTVTSLLCRPR